MKNVLFYKDKTKTKRTLLKMKNVLFYKDKTKKLSTHIF